MEASEKKEPRKISAFEYAINDFIDPKMNEGLRPETKGEQEKRRINALKNAASKLRIVKPSNNER